LAGYQIILDLLAARHFGHEHAATAVLAVGMELALGSRDGRNNAEPARRA
jgi:hypothetical protein